eukprot:m51a1_g13746 putative fha domain containing protein (296) ;mRNA; f:192183-193070
MLHKLEEQLKTSEAIIADIGKQQQQKLAQQQQQGLQGQSQHSFHEEQLEAERGGAAPASGLPKLLENLNCTICQDLIVTPMTLACSHSFCRACIAEWRQHKNECPVCRARIDAAPVMSLALNNAILCVVDELPAADREAYRSRQAEAASQAQAQAAPSQPQQSQQSQPSVHSSGASGSSGSVSDDERATRRLRASIAQARRQGMRFLSATDAWSDDEKRVFRDGVSRYASGSARAVYCESVGVTPAFVRSASAAQLRQAGANVGVVGCAAVLSVHTLRERLEAFIAGTVSLSRIV